MWYTPGWRHATMWYTPTNFTENNDGMSILQMIIIPNVLIPKCFKSFPKVLISKGFYPEGSLFPKGVILEGHCSKIQKIETWPLE